MEPRDSHILNAASNLLGIALVIITGLRVSGASRHSFSDEIAWAAALALTLSCILSYSALRSTESRPRLIGWADRVFLAGLFLLFGAVVVLAFASG